MADEKELLLKYNTLYKENDEFYHICAKTLGLSDCTFWILYALWETKKDFMQSELCSLLHLPKQTIHSALKKLECGGYISRELSPNQNTFSESQEHDTFPTERMPKTFLNKPAYESGHRAKYIHLTVSGAALAEKTVEHVMQAEINAFAGLTKEEQNDFINLFKKYTELLKFNLHLKGMLNYD